MYIALDHVQYVNNSSRSWTNRDKIKTLQGEKWLTVNVNKTSRKTAINQVELSNTINWRQDHFRLLEQNYGKTQYYNEIMPELKKLYSLPCTLLYEFNMASIKMLMDMLNIKIPILNSSSLKPTERKNELLVELLGKVSATHYLSGLGAKDYLEAEPFIDAGIDIIWQNFTHPIYTQQFGEFVPNLSTLDLLFNQGIKASGELLRRCQ